MAVQPSFATSQQPPRVNGNACIEKSSADQFTTSKDSACSLKPLQLFKGEPALFFSNIEISSLAAPFKLALVGKFSRGKPNMETLSDEFRSIGLNGDFKVGLLDSCHVLIRFALEEEYMRLWMKGLLNTSGFSMRLFKWSPDFRVTVEPSLVTAWTSFPQLPLHFFKKEILFSLASAVGKPLKIDEATASLSRPSVARVCVEVDLLLPLPNRIWIGYHGDSGFWQSIEFDNLPPYCKNCCCLGHSMDDCRKNKLALVPEEKASMNPSNFASKGLRVASQDSAPRQHCPSIVASADLQVPAQGVAPEPSKKRGSSMSEDESLYDSDQSESTSKLATHDPRVTSQGADPKQPKNGESSMSEDESLYRSDQSESTSKLATDDPRVTSQGAHPKQPKNGESSVSEDESLYDSDQSESESCSSETHASYPDADDAENAIHSTMEPHFGAVRQLLVDSSRTTTPSFKPKQVEVQLPIHTNDLNTAACNDQHLLDDTHQEKQMQLSVSSVATGVISSHAAAVNDCLMQKLFVSQGRSSGDDSAAATGSLGRSIPLDAHATDPVDVHTGASNVDISNFDFEWVKVNELEPDTFGHTVIVKVLKTKDVFRTNYGYSGSPTYELRMTECLVGDETGTIIFTARNEQIDLMRRGKTVILHNAKIYLFKGFMRLAVHRRGFIIEVTKPATFEVKRDNNCSLVKCEMESD